VLGKKFVISFKPFVVMPEPGLLNITRVEKANLHLGKILRTSIVPLENLHNIGHPSTGTCFSTIHFV
jgi:hypothetical protein